MNAENVIQNELSNITNVPAPPKSKALTFKQNIHYLRGLAALVVLLGHSGFYLDSYLQMGWAKVVFPDILGLYGVAIFFAISGYLMASLINKEGAFEFLARRVVRIYPLFVICTLITMFVIFPQLASRWLPLSITLAPMDGATYLMRVEWTIVHEMFFYVAIFFVALLGFQRWLNALAIVWLAAIALVAYMKVGMPSIGRADLGEIGFMSANTGFAAGLLIPTVMKQFRLPLLWVGLFAFAVILHHFIPAAYFRIIAGIGSAFLILAAVQAEFRVWHWLHGVLTKLGDWSYALYLIHVPILTYTYTHFIKDPSRWYIWPIAILSAVAAGAFLGEVDQWLTRVGKKSVSTANASIIQGLMIIFLIIYFLAAAYSIVR